MKEPSGFTVTEPFEGAPPDASENVSASPSGSFPESKPEIGASFSPVSDPLVANGARFGVSKPNTM